MVATPKTTIRTKKTHPARVIGGNVSEDIFNRGLCLPSGTASSTSSWIAGKDKGRASGALTVFAGKAPFFTFYRAGDAMKPGCGRGIGGKQGRISGNLTAFRDMRGGWAA